MKTQQPSLFSLFLFILTLGICFYFFAHSLGLYKQKKVTQTLPKKEVQESIVPVEEAQKSLSPSEEEMKNDDIAQSSNLMTDEEKPTAYTCDAQWRKAQLTNYTSYPEENSEECIVYNGCTWAGQFYGLEEKQSKEWVKDNNIVAVHKKDWDWLGMKQLKLRQGENEILATVYDICDDADCDDCCTKNLGGDGFLIDIEKYSMERFGIGDGIVEFQVCDSK